MDSRTNMKPAGRPKRLVTARRRETSPTTLALARTIRTERTLAHVIRRVMRGLTDELNVELVLVDL